MFFITGLKRKQIYLIAVLVMAILACTIPDFFPGRCSTTYLITQINAANADSNPDIIELAPNCIYELDAVDNSNAYGDNGLPIISSPIAIQGYHATITRSTAPGTPDFRFFFINPVGHLTLDNVIVTNGSTSSATNVLDSGGAILCHEGELTIIDSSVSGNSSQSSGGAVVVYKGYLTVGGSDFTGNQIVFGSGGAIAVEEGGGLTISDSQLTDNMATKGGALSIVKTTTTITNSTFSGNTAKGSWAGAIEATASELTVSGSEFTHNESTTSSGGAIAYTGDYFDFNNLVLYDTGFTITGSHFEDNQSVSAGGVLSLLNATSLVITNSTFVNNQVAGWSVYDEDEGSGSVIWIKEWAADVTTAVSIEGSTFDGNEANAGSVIHDIAGSNISVNTSTFSNNIGQYGPAGILTDGSLALVNSTFSGNLGDCSNFPNGACGIAIHIPSGSISFSTIVENQGPSSGAAVFAEGAGIKVNGSIIANNVGGDCGTSGGGSIGSSPASLDSDGSCQAPITADPLVDPLADNGGPTYTHALQVGSPALEAGLVSCPPNDQRGVSRPYPSSGECDLGAYEASDTIPLAQPEIPSDLVATSFPTPTPTSKPLVWTGIPKQDILCYRGPDPSFEVVSSLKANQEIALVGISEKGTYAVADNPIFPGVNCWARIDQLTIADEVKALLPTIIDPAFPTKTPTPTEKPAPPTATTKPSGTISGVVWKDSNGDGERQRGESDGISGLTVYLGQGACSSSGYKQTTTGGDGKFTFSSLPAGTYCLSVNVSPTCGGYTVATTATAYTINLSAGGSEFKRFGFTPLVCN